MPPLVALLLAVVLLLLLLTVELLVLVLVLLLLTVDVLLVLLLPVDPRTGLVVLVVMVVLVEVVADDEVFDDIIVLMPLVVDEVFDEVLLVVVEFVLTITLTTAGIAYFLVYCIPLLTKVDLLIVPSTCHTNPPCSNNTLYFILALSYSFYNDLITESLYLLLFCLLRKS